MKRPKLRAAYDDHDEISEETGLYCEDPSLAQQHQKDETDINLIVRTYLRTGELPTHKMPPLEQDFHDAVTMEQAMQLGIEARNAFMEHPAEIRSKFNNDAATFVAFASDPENTPELFKMGLLSEEAASRYNAQKAAEAAERARDKADAEEHRKGGRKDPPS